MLLHVVNIVCPRIQSSFNTSGESADPASNRSCKWYTGAQNTIEGSDRCSSGEHSSTELATDDVNVVGHFLSETA
jgi:hypothetical protein